MDSKNYHFNYKQFYWDLIIAPPWLIIFVIFFYFYLLPDNKYIPLLIPLFFLLLALIYYFNLFLLYKHDGDTIFCVENQIFRVSNSKQSNICFKSDDIIYIERHEARFISGLNTIEYAVIIFKDGSCVKITCFLPLNEILQQVDSSKIFKNVSPLLIGLVKKGENV